MSYSTKAAAMFGTISFSNKDPSKNFKPGSGLGHPSRKFACETCRVHKVRKNAANLSQDSGIGV
ncbi:hypothetical protein PHISCL_04950 [Aspergillus sclerotialis]|uniref:Uncharacterized protein n=1 Tax=Aspergillus sclerotialis TaxID=2070753 RepID=A0A3A2ZTW3_9EURO|nr:hypothetical protein PHISCL_04950 [Aspergillus sclerotialis]